jgi:hypothetical protein
MSESNENYRGFHSTIDAYFEQVILFPSIIPLSMLISFLDPSKLMWHCGMMAQHLLHSAALLTFFF